MNRMMAIFDMGGRGAYIWSAWAIFILVIGATVIYVLRQRQHTIQQNSQLYARREHIKHRQTKQAYLEQDDADSSAP